MSLTGIFATKADANFSDGLTLSNADSITNPVNKLNSDNPSSNQASINSDGLIEFIPDEVGRYSLYYTVSDGSSSEIGTFVIDVVPSAPTITINTDTITVNEETASGLTDYTVVSFGSDLILGNTSDFADPGSSLLLFLTELMTPVQLVVLVWIVLL